MKHRLVRSASLLVLLAAAVSASAANLVVNGGFETGDLSGWTVGGGGAVSASSVNGTASGQYAAYFYGPTTDDATLSQSVATIAGQTYRFSFAYYIEGAGNPPSAYDVGINAYLDGQFVFGTGFNQPTNGFETFTLDYVATSGVTTIRFNGGTQGLYAALDDVSLDGPRPSPTPGPAAALPFALMALRRRKRA